VICFTLQAGRGWGASFSGPPRGSLALLQRPRPAFSMDEVNDDWVNHSSAATSSAIAWQGRAAPAAEQGPVIGGGPFYFGTEAEQRPFCSAANTASKKPFSADDRRQGRGLSLPLRAALSRSGAGFA
jgi:hypothetical protein